MRIILHIDFNSYFATVEQQCNPFLRGKPIAVGGSPGSRAVIVAASKEAKEFGVKTAMNPYEAIRLCPGLIFVDGDPTKYAELTQKFINIGKRYTDRLEVYSIDELFMDLTGWVRDFAGACRVAKSLKKNLHDEVGDYLTCSVGIAQNRLMAKLASDMQKPDGLVVIRPEDARTFLDWIELTDVPGIANRLKVRLFDMGIRTLRQLGDHPVEELQRQFGPNNGLMLSEMGRGEYEEEVPYAHEIEPAKSMGHNYTLKKDTLDRGLVYKILLVLSEKVGRRLRRDQYQGRRVWVHLRWEDFHGSGEGKTLKHFIDDGFEIYKTARQMLDDWYIYKPVRLVGVGVTMLKHNGRQLPALKEVQRQDQLVDAQDLINDRYGERTIQRASVLSTSLRRKVGGFKEPHQFK